jgi:ABC-type nitrate/sulfonate/bicarbonate transport system substrate-binding protein
MNRFRWSFAAAISAAAFLAAVSWQESSVQAQQSGEKLVRIASARGVDFVALWGMAPFAAKYGIRTEMVPVMTNADQQRVLQSGGVQVATLGYQSPAIMAEQGVKNVKVIAGLYLGGQNLILRKGVELKSWKDLEGKKIGRAPGTFAQILFILAAEANGVDISKINLVNVTAVGTAELQALKNGDLDGLVLFSPMIDRPVVDGYAYYPSCCDISSTKEFDGRNQILAANTAFLKDRKTAVNFLKAYLDSESFYLHNQAKEIETITEYTGVDKAVVEVALKHAKLEHRVDIQTAVAIAKQGPKFGFTKTDMGGKVASYFDLSYLSEATGKPISELDTIPK